MVFPEAFTPVAHEAISLYIHIPFCSSRCDYCDFFSTSGATPAVFNKTLHTILEDGRQALEKLGSPHIHTVFIGGGTPSMIDPETLDWFLERLNTLVYSAGPDRGEVAGGTRSAGHAGRIKQSRIESIEYTMEVNPETVTSELLDVLENRGINRLSLGIQTFDNGGFEYLGRRATPEDNRRALELIHRRTFGSISFDIITGMVQAADTGRGAEAPGPAHTTIGDLEKALRWKPDHISLYTLTVEEGTRLAKQIRNGRKPPVDEETQTNAFLAAAEYLQENGYKWYEVSNFARPGAQCRHNLSYWRMRPYLGLGPSAVSTVAGAEGPLRIEASRNLQAPEYRAERLSPRDLLFEHLIMGLRLTEGVDRAKMTRIFGIDPAEALTSSLQTAESRDYMEITNDALRCTRTGSMYLDLILRGIARDMSDIEIGRCDWP